MPKWTNEQLDAIKKNGSNIIVSAGAGSGKTAVLSERVIEHLQKGIKINELLILTFTNAAAREMKERIRKKISEHDELKDNLDYLENAYITTFDSYTLSLVRKYCYLLNISPNVSIVDDSIISIVKSDILDEVFDELYLENNSLFNKLISDFAIKNDTSIKSSILKIIKGIELKSDEEEFLNNYVNNYLSDEKIDKYIEEFNVILKHELEEIETNLMYLESSSYYNYYDELSRSLEKLIKSAYYDEIIENINVTLPRRPRGSDEIKEYKDNIDTSIKNIKSYLRFKNTEEIKNSFNIIKDYINIIIEIIKRFNIKLNNYKHKEDLYEFIDISKMAIRLLKENDYIRDELKYFYKEIAIDEYQDTNDLQEEFVNLIENNNVYMVGDIKQSIYGFRNANPSIFKEKYESFSNLNGGIKIDLLKNFRSRSEALKGINEIFNLIMDDSLGGASYKETHQMVAGNEMYEKNKASQNYNLEIINYDAEGEVATYEEIESFIIGKDILNKIKEEYKVIDKETGTLRKVKYEDFCIIMDRGSSFPTTKKIFEYLGIPLTIYEDKKLTNEIDVILINNIIGMILKIKDNILDQEFKYYFMSIARSFLFEYKDDKIFNIIKNNTYKDDYIYNLCLEISEDLNILNNYDLLQIILNKFNYYEKLILIGNVEDAIIRINNLLNISKNLNNMGYTPYMFKEYISKMIDGKNEIKYSSNNKNTSSVKIMNIHKSKGLEFPICYFCGFRKEFNTMDIKERFTFDNKYGIITPYFDEGIGTTILKDLLKNKYVLDNISERIRLLYVALTRAKEKIIIVAPLSQNREKAVNIVDYNIRRKYNSFLSILNSISANLENYINTIDLTNVGITKDYIYGIKENEKIDKKVNKVITYEDINITNEIINQKHASKEIHELINREDAKILETGIKLHKYFEQTDFFNIEDDNPYKEQIKLFRDKLNITKDTEIYKEHEFIFEHENTTIHGIIDLVLVDNKTVKIVDYKLKNIDDPKYIDQLNVYYNYLKTIFNKEIKIYLYSILNNEVKEVIVN